MTHWKRYLLVISFAGAPVWAQTAPLPYVAPISPDDIAGALAAAEDGVRSLDLAGPALLEAQSALAQVRREARFSDSSLQRAARRGDDAAYDSGTRALDEGRYDDAIRTFDRVIAAKSDRADGALYWKAYALNRLGRRDEAIATIGSLRREYPNSRWLNDAQALEVEAKQSSGQAVSPADEANEDLKLMAINGLMRADPDKAIPLLEDILKGNSSPRLKDRALFVLTQSRTPRARQVLAGYAKGGANPDLQLRAIRYIGVSGATDAQQQLVSIYQSSNDPVVKREILRSLFAGGGSAKLLELERNEKDPALRMEAIRDLSQSRDTQPATLIGLYNSSGDTGTKKEVVHGLFARGDAKDLVDLARKETNPEMKKAIVQQLSMMHNKEALDYMMELLK